MKMTYSLEMLRTILKKCPEYELIKANFTAGSIVAVVKDGYDGQSYDIEIKPKREA